MKLTKSKKSEAALKARAVETRRILRLLIADLNDENDTNDLTVWVILRQLCRTYRPDYVLTALTDVIDNEKF